MADMTTAAKLLRWCHYRTTRHANPATQAKIKLNAYAWPMLPSS